MTLADFQAQARQIDVLDSTMSYHQEGTGPAIVFLHGNPTSSILWRNVIPYVSDLGRCVAPDLIGMGRSGKPDPREGAAYRFVEHRRYLDALLDQLDLGADIVLVLHDWGSALGFDWASRHRDRVAGIAYMESIVAPVPSWDDWADDSRRMFQAMRSEQGERIVIEGNGFVERILPAAVLRPLPEEVMAAYRAPYRREVDRWPTLQWPREIPIEGEPADVTAIVSAYAGWLAGADVPKLFVNADPGSVLIGRARELCRTWPQQTEITVPGNHFIPEDSPDEVGRALADWIPTIR